MLDPHNHPILSRLVPLTVDWVWPILVLWWSVTLLLVPPPSANLFGWTTSWFVDILASASILASALVVVNRSSIVSRLIFLVVPGFVFFGRFTSFITTDLLVATGWKARMLGASIYAIAATGHVVLTAVSVMITTQGGTRERN